MKIVLTGSVPSKKNSRITTRTGRSFPNKIYTDWEKDVLGQLRLQKLTACTTYPVRLTCIFYTKDKVHRDLDNMLSSILDVLKDYKKKGVVIRQGIFKDDSWLYVRPIILDVAGVDKLNPRVEIYVDEIVTLESP